MASVVTAQLQNWSTSTTPCLHRTGKSRPLWLHHDPNAYDTVIPGNKNRLGIANTAGRRCANFSDGSQHGHSDQEGNARRPSPESIGGAWINEPGFIIASLPHCQNLRGADEV